MRLFARLVLACALLAGAALPAAAEGWQGTRWGMGPGEVGQIFPGATRVDLSESTRYCGEGFRSLLTMPYRTSDFEFRADLCFDSANRLGEVRLALIDPAKGDALVATLAKKYGQPSSYSQDGGVETALWYEPDNLVAFLRLTGAPPSVLYAARKSASSNGL